MRVPFVDLKRQDAEIRAEIARAIDAVIDRADFILGSDVSAFEQEFAAYCERDYAIGVDSGSSAIELALRACGIGAGDEVITVSFTFVATVAAIAAAGAVPVLVDIDPVTYTIDPALIERALTPRTRAIVPVHLYGQPSHMAAVLEIADRHDLFVIEDACQAHGARYEQRRAGSMGDAGCFSFYPAKNLGAYGDGGAVVTADAGIAESIRVLRNSGQDRKHHHVKPAFTRRLDTLQAAVLRVKLGHLDAWNRARGELAAQYDRLLAGTRCSTPRVPADRTHVYHLYVVQHDERDALIASLAARGVGSGLHYPRPVHLQPAYRSLASPGSLPVSEAAAGRVLSLPMFPGMSGDEVAYVTEQIRRSLA
jgi:dTDP-4-amino-4,6-dideoxygalactose transaminase